jgi:hypothetical protein
MGAGINLTISGDLAPSYSPAAFLSFWRFSMGVAGFGGPALAAWAIWIAGFGAAPLLIGAMGLAGCSRDGPLHEGKPVLIHAGLEIRRSINNNFES